MTEWTVRSLAKASRLFVSLVQIVSLSQANKLHSRFLGEKPGNPGLEPGEYNLVGSPHPWRACAVSLPLELVRSRAERRTLDLLFPAKGCEYCGICSTMVVLLSQTRISGQVYCPIQGQARGGGQQRAQSNGRPRQREWERDSLDQSSHLRIGPPAQWTSTRPAARGADPQRLVTFRALLW